MLISPLPNCHMIPRRFLLVIHKDRYFFAEQIVNLQAHTTGLWHDVANSGDCIATEQLGASFLLGTLHQNQT